MSTTVAHLEKTRPQGTLPAEHSSGGRNHAAWGYALAVLAIIAGFPVADGYYLTAESGMGYALGIVGGSLMLTLMLYPLRKRYRALRFLGPVRYWFKAHMVFGVIGPILILYHCNFRIGSTNSTVALVCMLLVAGSGVIGRYLYSKIHNGLYGRRLTLDELRRAASQAQHSGGSVAVVVPGLTEELEKLEHRLMEPASPLLVVLNPLLASARAWLMRWRLRRRINQRIRFMSEQQPRVAEHASAIRLAASRYSDRRLKAARRVAQFALFERMFALWHILHFPLFLMMVLTAIVHVIAVHMY